nr:hypothetical protein [Shumkonia mesophila]
MTILPPGCQMTGRVGERHSGIPDVFDDVGQHDQIEGFAEGDGFAAAGDDIEADVAGSRDFGFIYVETDQPRRPDVENPAASRQVDDQGMSIPYDAGGRSSRTLSPMRMR